jgi:hypothetical protein
MPRHQAQYPAAYVRTAALLLVALLLGLAGCGGAQVNQTVASATSTATVQPATTATPRPTVPAGPPPVRITDLTTFRQQLSVAFTSNTWSKVTPLLSPQFSFQGLDSGGARMEMPDSAADLQRLYTRGGPWSQASQYEVEVHSCYAGSTPASQQLGFDGGGGSFILVGMDRWQGYWVVAWAFQDPLGGYDGCASG